MVGRKTHVRTIVLSAVSALALMLGAGMTSADEAETVNFDIEGKCHSVHTLGVMSKV